MDFLEDCNAWMWLKHDKYRVELNVGSFLEKLAGRRSRNGFLVDFGGWRLPLGGFWGSREHAVGGLEFQWILKGYTGGTQAEITRSGDG